MEIKLDMFQGQNHVTVVVDDVITRRRNHFLHFIFKLDFPPIRCIYDDQKYITNDSYLGH